MNDFKIELENIPDYYTPGQQVVGQVLFNVTTDEEKVAALTLRCIGKAFVEWTESGPVPVSFSKEEKYFDHLISLNQNEEIEPATYASTTKVFPRGLHSFPFNFELPLGIPSTFDSVYGWIKYILEASVEIESHKEKENSNFTTKLEILVNDVLDLNDFPEFSQPIQLRKSKTVWCLCCQNGPVGFKVSLDKTGFLPGEIVSNTTELFNLSSSNVIDTRITLVRDLSFHTDRRTKVLSSTILCVLCLPGIEPGEQEIVENSWTIIPRTPPVNLLGCRIITVRHYLKFQMDISLSFNLHGNIPIKIGMVPFRENLQTLTKEPKKRTLILDAGELELIQIPSNLKRGTSLLEVENYNSDSQLQLDEVKYDRN